MSLLYMDSFELYASISEAILGRWTAQSNASISTTTYRNGAKALKVGSGASAGNIYKSFSNYVTWIVGFGAYFGDIDSGVFFSLGDGGSTQVDLRINADGSITVTRNGTTLQTTAIGVITLNTWYYIEFKATIDNSGSYELRVNKTTVASGSAVDTQATANAYANRITFYGGGVSGLNPNPVYDDLYVLNGLGSIRNDFLGDCKVPVILPNAAGDLAQFTPSAGSNYENVDEATPDGDTTYNASSTVAQADAYALADVTLTGDILGIQVDGYVRKDDAGSRSTKLLIRISGTNYYGSDYSLPDTYIHTQSIWETNPATSAAFTDADLDSLQAGIEVVS